MQVLAAIALVAVFWYWQISMTQWAWRLGGHDPKVMWRRYWKFLTDPEFKWWEDE